MKKNEQRKKHDEATGKAVNMETTGYCLQMGSNYCKNECPNQCHDRFQDLIDKLFEDAIEKNIGARE